MNRFYQVIGVERDKTGNPTNYYNLCYTGSKKAALAYYVDNGWDKKDILFRRKYQKA